MSDRNFSTGARRGDDEGKYRASEQPAPENLPINTPNHPYHWVDYRDFKSVLDYTLLPWYIIRGLIVHFMFGAERYGKHNWQKGIPLSSYYNSATRHLMQWWYGATDEPHLYSALWNIVVALWTEREIAKGRLPKELDDR